MDLDKLKGSWKRYTNELSNKEQKNTSDLNEILKRRSQRSLRKLQRNFFIEAGLNIILVPIIILFLLQTDFMEGNIQVFFISLLSLILVVFMVYLYRSYKRIYQYENNDLYLKEKLKQQINSLQRFIREYHWFTYFIYFIAFPLGLAFEIPEKLSFILVRFGLGLGVGVAVFFLILRPLVRLYIKKLYGSHLKALKSVLSELEEQNQFNNTEHDSSR